MESVQRCAIQSIERGLITTFTSSAKRHATASSSFGTIKHLRGNTLDLEYSNDTLTALLSLECTSRLYNLMNGIKVRNLFNPR